MTQDGCLLKEAYAMRALILLPAAARADAPAVPTMCGAWRPAAPVTPAAIATATSYPTEKA
jgi:hypothetical protein